MKKYDDTNCCTSSLAVSSADGISTTTAIMAVVNSFKAFFSAVQSAIEYLRDILSIINDYVSTIASIARGAIEPGAQKLESALGNAIPIAIGFLANQFGLGNISEVIKQVVMQIRGYVDKGIDWLLDKAISAFNSIMSIFTGKRQDEELDPKDHTSIMAKAVKEMDIMELNGTRADDSAIKHFSPFS